MYKPDHKSIEDRVSALEREVAMVGASAIWVALAALALATVALTRSLWALWVLPLALWADWLLTLRRHWSAISDRTRDAPPPL